MLGSALMLGQSLAAAITGSVAENLGTDPAMTLPLFAAILVMLLGIANWLLTPSGRR